MTNKIETPEMLDCEDFEEDPNMNCKDYNVLQCIGCGNCKTKFKDDGIGTTFECKFQYPIVWIHIWQSSRRYKAVKIRSVVYRSSYIEEVV